MDQTTPDFWRKCSSCKNPIALKSKYYVCSVSTCTGQRTGYVFCSVSCFERHLPGARHKQAGAIEKISPASADPGEITPESDNRAPARIIVKPTATQSNPQASSSPRQQLPREVLIIASRLKEYIAAKADYNTSGGVIEVLSDYVRVLCDRAIENARAEGRKTVLDRDFHFLKKESF